MIWGSEENQWGFCKHYELPIFLLREKGEYVFIGTQSALNKLSQILHIFILSELHWIAGKNK